MARWARLCPALAASGLSFFTNPTSLGAQSEPVLTFGGEVRPRFEARDPVEGRWQQATSMRTRLSMSAATETGLRLFIQLQDVRDWGEETSVRDRAADAVDFHQAYLEVDRFPGVGGLLRAGRQEVGLAEQRLMGAPDWGQAGQTFDGLRWIRPRGDDHVELIYVKTGEARSPAHEREADLAGVWYSAPTGALGTVDVLGIHDREKGPEATRQTTIGGDWKMTWGDLAFRTQGFYQTGRRVGMKVRAFMLSGEAGVSILGGKGTATLWYDYLSGDGRMEDDETGAFSTLYGARNRYYGRADYFTDIPVSTGGLGLSDAVLKLAFQPTETTSANLDLHSFRTAQKGDLSSRHLGEEIDVWIRHRFRTYLTFQAGASLTWADSAMEELGLLQGTGTFVYFMTSLRL